MVGWRWITQRCKNSINWKFWFSAVIPVSSSGLHSCSSLTLPAPWIRGRNVSHGFFFFSPLNFPPHLLQFQVRPFFQSSSWKLNATISSWLTSSHVGNVKSIQVRHVHHSWAPWRGSRSVVFTRKYHRAQILLKYLCACWCPCGCAPSLALPEDGGSPTTFPSFSAVALAVPLHTRGWDAGEGAGMESWKWGKSLRDVLTAGLNCNSRSGTRIDGEYLKCWIPALMLLIFKVLFKKI